MTGARTAARRAALQMLFAGDLSGASSSALRSDYWREFPGDPEDRVYADEAVEGVLSVKPRLDALIVEASAHWRLERMSPVTRAILRLGTWELLERTEIPTAVVLDEAVEVAKSFGAADTGRFVNGVLNGLAQRLRGTNAKPPSTP